MVPITQRRFVNIWAELDYLCTKTRYWLYTRKERAKAERYLDRLKRVLHDLPENDLAIIREEGLALLAKLEGEFGEAIAHRQREIQFMERLLQEAQSPRDTNGTKAYMLRDRGRAALRQRVAILDALKKKKADGLVRQ